MQSKPKKNKIDLNAFDSDEDQSTSVISDTDLDKNFEKKYANYLKIDIKNQNILDFRHKQSRNFPIYSILVKMFLATTATSVPSETLFSASGYQVWNRRNSRNDCFFIQKLQTY